MSGRKLFLDRMRKDWVFQWKAINSVADWTVWVYLIIPGVVIFLAIYKSWWSETPEWIVGMPIALLLIILYFLCCNGGLRTYLEEADQLFLLQKRRLVHDLKKWSVSYSMIYQCLIVFVLFAIPAPFFLNHYGLSWPRLISIVVFFSASKLLVLALNVLLTKILNTWLRNGAQTLLFIILAFIIISTSIKLNNLLIISIAVLFLAFTVTLTRSWIHSRRWELQNIEHDKKNKLKNVRFILMSTDMVPREPILNRKKPILFRNSGRIFSARTTENGLVELFTKVFIRNSSHIFGYLQIVGISTTAIFVLPPIWMKALIYILFLLFLARWMESVWTIVMTKPLIRSLIQNNDRSFPAKRKAMKLFLFPAYGLVGLFLTISILLTILFNF